MRLKKLFRTEIIVFLVLILIIPSIDGFKIIKDKKTRMNETLGYNDIIVFFNKLEFKRYEQIDGKCYSIYLVDYAIKNIGDELYEGGPFTRLFGVDRGIFGWWIENIIILEPGEHINLSKEVKILSVSDPYDDTYRELDDERYFADHEIAIVSSHFEAPDTFPKRTITRAKYWNDDADYEPTLAHLLVSTPWRYETKNDSINLSDAYFLEIKNLDELPVAIKKRLGYIKDLYNYLVYINEEIKLILQKYNESFLSEAWTYIEPILLSIEDICNWYKEVVNRIQHKSDIITLLERFSNITKDNVILLANLSQIYYDDIIPEIENMQVISNSLFDFVYNKKTWKKKIRVFGDINGVKLFEKIKVKCREYNGVYRDFYDKKIDRKVNFNFFTKPLFAKERYYDIHNCTLTVEGNRHKMPLFIKTREKCFFRKNKVVSSESVFSYCFSNGEININFIKKDWDKSYLKERGFNFSHIFIKNKNKNYIYKKKYFLKSNERDITYKKYYPGAPMDDPHIVYYVGDEVIVRFKPSVDITKIKDVEGFPIIDKEEKLNTVLIEVTDIDIEDFINHLNEKKDILYAALNLIGTGCDIIPTDPYWDKQWGHRVINLPKAWEISQGSGAVVAILDSGVDCSKHEDIDKSRIIYQYNYVHENKYAIDFNGHGTHCTGLIMSNFFDKGIAGVAPKCKVVLIKVLNDDVLGTLFNVVQGIVKASELADIICMSWVFYGAKKTDLAYLIDGCEQAYKDGAVLIASSGNQNVEMIAYPAVLDDVIAVGAIDENYNRWVENTKYGSNYGDKLDIVAPGKNIFSTLPNNSYGYRSGTSPAAAYVAGVAALYYGKYHGCSPEVFKKALISSAKDLGEKGWDKFYGYGLIDAYKLLNYEEVYVDFRWSPQKPHAFEKIKLEPLPEIRFDFITFLWDFENDGKIDVECGETTYTYYKPGTYQCKLIGIADNGKTDVAIHEITVLPRRNKSI